MIDVPRPSGKTDGRRAHIVTGDHYNGALASPAQRVWQPSSPIGPAACEASGRPDFVLFVEQTVKARRCDFHHPKDQR
jgi:hypothetical protein